MSIKEHNPGDPHLPYRLLNAISMEKTDAHKS